MSNTSLIVKICNAGHLPYAAPWCERCCLLLYARIFLTLYSSLLYRSEALASQFADLFILVPIQLKAEYLLRGRRQT